MNPFESSMRVLRKSDATSDTAKLHLWSWLIIKMILRAGAWGVWAYFASVSMTWVKPLPTKRALRTPERGPMTQRDSMTLARSSLEGSLRGSGSYTSWPELTERSELFLDGFLDFLLWIALKITLIPFLKNEIFKQLKFLIYFFLNAIDWLLTYFKDAFLEWVDHVDLVLWWGFAFQWLFFWLAEAEVVLEVAESEHLLILKVLLLKLKSGFLAGEDADSGIRPEERTTWESDFADLYLTLFFCWSKNFLNKILEQHLITWALLIVNIWFMSSHLELLEFFDAELIFSNREWWCKSWGSDHRWGWRCACL